MFINKLLHKNLIQDSVYNILSFGLLVGGQQLLVLPIIGSIVSPDEFGLILLLLGISNVLGLLGCDVAYIHIVAPLTNKENSYIHFLFLIIPLVLLLAILLECCLFANMALCDKFLFPGLCVTTSLRSYFNAEYQINLKFKRILVQNVLYVFGIILGLCVSRYLNIWLAVFIVGDLFALSLSLKRMREISRIKCSIGQSRKGVLNYVNYLTKDIITYMLNLFDRFIIYPTLGGGSVGIYFSMTSVSKFFALVLNPLSMVFFVHFSDIKRNKMELLNIILVASLLFVLVITLVLIFVIPLYVKLFYPLYFNSIASLYIWVAILSGISCGLIIFKSLIVRLCPLDRLRDIYAVYMLLFICLSIFFVSKFQLQGFVMTNIVLNLILFVALFFLDKR